MRELRVVTLDRAAHHLVRAANEDGSEGDVVSISFEGHAAVFEQRTLIGGRRWGFVEKVAAGAFDDVLASPALDTRFLHNHDPNWAMARTTAEGDVGMLRLSTDPAGLLAAANMVPTTQARDLAMLLDARVIRQMSFAFTVAGDEWRELPDDDPEFPGMEERTITRIGELFDVSTVTYPAYAGTDAALRGATEDDARAVLEAAGRGHSDGALRALELARARHNARAVVYGVGVGTS